jgi:hypothetical protein
MGAGATCGPGKRRKPGFEPQRHQLVIGGMILHDVDPMAEAVMGDKDGRDALGELGSTLDRCAGAALAERDGAVVYPGAALPRDRFRQSPVAEIRVVPDQRRGLVGHRMRLGIGGVSWDRHGRLLGGHPILDRTAVGCRVR